MAYCEFCHADVLPGDLFVVPEGSSVRYFCSQRHYRMSENGETLEGEVTVTAKEGETVLVTPSGHSVTLPPPPAADLPLTTEQSGEEEADEYLDEGEWEPFVCAICSFESKTKAGLMAHQRAKHK